ncbi:MAG: sugar phosphate nucleotidyltransferase [Armatimonadaceae bacterium]
MKIGKAIITAAAPDQQDLPVQNLVDRDGVRKSVLSIQVEEMVRAGVDEIGVVICPGSEAAYREAAGELAERVSFIVQETPRGYGHAVHCAKDFLAGEAFLHQVGDHIFLPHPGRVHSAEQVAAIARENDCAVSGVQPTREHLLPYFGTVGGQRVKGTQDLYLIERVEEKPTPTEAEQTLMVPGLRAGHYLCFVGTHVLTPLAMEILDRHVRESGESRNIQLSPVLNELAQREKYLAVETQGRRYPLDTRYGLLNTQLALALSGVDRDEVLTNLTELLAVRERGNGGA